MDGTAAAQRLLSPFLALPTISGASICVDGGLGRSTIAASDRLAADIDRLQFELGDGPHEAAMRSGEPVLVPDLGEATAHPLLAAAVRALGVNALFAFPMTMGAVMVGAVTLHRTVAGELDSRVVAVGRQLAGATAADALRQAARAADQPDPVSGTMTPELRREVHQATGMLIVQLDLSASDAFARLQAHAFANDVSLDSVASDVVARRLTLEEDGAAT